MTTKAELPDRARRARSGTGPAGLGRLPDGRPIVVQMRSQQLRSLASDGTSAQFAGLGEPAVNEGNELVTDTRGRSYTGGYGSDALAGAEPRPAASS